MNYYIDRYNHFIINDKTVIIKRLKNTYYGAPRFEVILSSPDNYYCVRYLCRGWYDSLENLAKHFITIYEKGIK